MKSLVEDCDELSVTLTVKPKVPAAVGVPLMVPLDGSRVRPGGSAPEAIDHVYGAVPPEACSVVEYEVPTMPLGSCLAGWC